MSLDNDLTGKIEMSNVSKYGNWNAPPPQNEKPEFFKNDNTNEDILTYNVYNYNGDEISDFDKFRPNNDGSSYQASYGDNDYSNNGGDTNYLTPTKKQKNEGKEEFFSGEKITPTKQQKNESKEEFFSRKKISEEILSRSNLKESNFFKIRCWAFIFIAIINIYIIFSFSQILIVIIIKINIYYI